MATTTTAQARQAQQQPAVPIGQQVLLSQQPTPPAPKTTPRFLRRIQIAVAATMLALCGITMSCSNTAIDQVEASAAVAIQAAQLTDMDYDLKQAYSEAEEYLSLDEATRSDQDLDKMREWLDQASATIITASAESTLGTDWLIDLDSQVSHYSRILERAATFADLQSAQEVLEQADHVRSSIATDITSNADTAAQAVRVTPSANITGIAMSWMVVVWCVGLCIPVARRSHRVLNLGMLGTVAASGVIAWWFSAQAASFASSAGQATLLVQYLGQMTVLGTVAPVICLIGGIAGVWGIQQRIREYK